MFLWPKFVAKICMFFIFYISGMKHFRKISFCHILPARAINVIAIIRIDQINSGVSSNPRRSKKISGAASKKIAEAPKTTAPPLSVFFTPC